MTKAAQKKSTNVTKLNTLRSQYFLSLVKCDILPHRLYNKHYFAVVRYFFTFILGI